MSSLSLSLSRYQYKHRSQRSRSSIVSHQLVLLYITLSYTCQAFLLPQQDIQVQQIQQHVQLQHLQRTSGSITSRDRISPNYKYGYPNSYSTFSTLAKLPNSMSNNNNDNNNNNQLFSLSSIASSFQKNQNNRYLFKSKNKNKKTICNNNSQSHHQVFAVSSSSSSSTSTASSRNLILKRTAKRAFGFLCTTLLAYIYINMYGRHTIFNNVAKSIQTIFFNFQNNIQVNNYPGKNYMKAAAEIVLDSYRDFQLVPKSFDSASRLSDGSQFTLPPWIKNPYALATLVGKGPLFFGVYGLVYYKAVTKLIPAEADRVRAALEEEEEEKKKYIENLKEKEGINLGSIKGSFSSNELMLIKIVENGDRLKSSEKTGWQQLLQRAKYTKDVMDGKRKANKDIPVMNKYEVKRVIKANKLVKEKGFE